ncbi:MAG: radical SAM/SPASM domain-containing protein [Myxococcota bacterium]
MTTTPINKGQFHLEPPERVAAFERHRGHGYERAYRENRRQWTEFAQAQVVSEYPMHVDLELASICNLRCPMCYTVSKEFRKQVNAKLMDYELFTKLVDECAAGGVYSIRLSYRGESFLHPRIVDTCRYAKGKGIFEVSTLTNGLKLDEEMFVDLMDAGLDWLTISFDGIGEVYEKIRKPAKFDRAVEKIANYQRIKRAAGKVKPVVKVQTVLPAIEGDPAAFYDIFAPITDLVSANPLIDFHGDVSAQPRIADFSCPQLYQRLTVGADGTVMMCANDEKQEHVVGNAYRETLHSIWHGHRMRDARAAHAAHRGCQTMVPCSKCYLPLDTHAAPVKVGERKVVAEKYTGGVQKLVQLRVPKRFVREGLEV